MNLMKVIKKRNYIDCFPYQSDYDEFKNNYYSKKLFINPPFSKMKEVSNWIIDQLKNWNKIVLLIPARTDTEYFHKLLDTNPIVIFIKGRLHYNEEGSAPFPSVLLIWDTRLGYRDLFNKMERLYYYIDKKRIEEIFE